MKNRPPRLARRFFSWYCKNHLHDSILGDLEEQFCQNQDAFGTWGAQWRYWLDVLRFMNRFTLRRERYITSYNSYSTGMIKNNLISSFRFLARNKGFTFINIFGLTIGLTSFIFILLFVNHELSFDEFHTNKDDVYRVNFSFKDNAGNVTTLVNSPPALAPGVTGQFPELKRISRMRYTNTCLLSKDEIGFYEDRGFYADSVFLEILQFDLSSGDPNTALDMPNAIVISEALALKLFNKPDPIGATLSLNNSISLKVTGVLAPIPSNSHLNFDYLISFPTYVVPDGYSSDLTSWSWLGFLTYVELSPNADPSRFEKKLRQHFKDLNPENPNPMLPVVQNLSDIYLGSTGMADDLASHMRTGNSFSVNALMIVVVLILLVACFNFSNLTNALSINRSKASGIRKVLGAGKRGIILQLITESMLLTLFCLLLSIGLLLLIFPSIAEYMSWDFKPSLSDFMLLVPFLVIVVILIGIVSGLYPAFTLAGYDIIKSLKGSLKIETKGSFQMKNLLVLMQFAISVGLISATLIMTRQINYMTNKAMGFSTENVVLIKMLPEEMTRYYDVFKEELNQHASVLSASRSERVLGEPWPWTIIQRTDQGPETSKRVFFNQVDFDYLKTLDIEMNQGRPFSESYSGDATGAIIINKTAADYLGLENPMGQQVYFMGQESPRTIIGVTEDFNYTSLHEEIGPAVIILPFINLDYMYVRFAPGNLMTQIDVLEESWEQVSADSPLSWNFLDQNLDQLYKAEERFSLIIQFFSGLTIVLSCLGLYGIVAFMINNRIKEFGVRKVLGASVRSLYILFIRKYIYQILLASVVVIPLAHHLLTGWLESFAYHIQINIAFYLLAILALFLVIIVTISSQILKAAKANPTTLLRSE